MTEKKIPTYLNTLYLVKILVERIDDNAPEEVEVCIDGIAESIKQTDFKIHFNIPTSSSSILDERKEVNDWYEQSIFINSGDFVELLNVGIDTKFCKIHARITPVVIKPSETKALSKTFTEMKTLITKWNKQNYNLFLNVDVALDYLDSFVEKLGVTKHPILKIKVDEVIPKPKEIIVGLLGDQSFFGLLETTYNVVKLSQENINLVTQNFFDVIILQRRSTQLLSFGATTEDEKEFIEEIKNSLKRTNTPIVELSSSEAEQNTIYSTLKPLKNCSYQAEVEVGEFEICNFSPIKHENRFIMSVLVPCASDLYQFARYMQITNQLVEFGFKVSIFEANYGHVPLRTSERFDSPRVKVYQTLSPIEIASLSQQSGFVFISANSLRDIRDIMNLCSIAITNGAIPIVLGTNINKQIEEIAISVMSFTELYATIVQFSTSLSHEKKWLSLFRRFKSLQRQGNLQNAIKNIVMKRENFNKLESSPSTEMICVTKRVHMFDNILATYERQSYVNLKMHLIWNIAENERQRCKEIIEKYSSDKIRISIVEQSYNIGNCLNYGIRNSNADYWFKVDDDDYYGKYYIEDMVNWYETTQADVVGKPSAFMYLSQTGETILRGHAESQMRKKLRVGKYFCGATLSGRKLSNLPMFSNYYRNSCDSKWIEVLNEKGYKVFIGDYFNFIIHRGDIAQHTWQIEEKQLKEKSIVLSKMDLKGWIDAK